METEVFEFRATDYGPEVAAILALDREAARERLGAVSAAQIFAGARAPEAAMCGLYVYFSYFDVAHAMAQNIDTPEGSYWHAIVHREEPDASNAAYWFRQVGRHPIFPLLARAVGQEGPWNPFAFIEKCAAPDARTQDIQPLEWQLLFDYCARKATAQLPARV
jgi:hypothetical protein